MSRAQLTSTVEQNTGGAVSPYVAGKNKVINGDMSISQRGQSFTYGAGGYTLDRYTYAVASAIPSGTITQQAFTAGTAPVAGYESSYFFRSNITAANGCTNITLENKIEDVRTFAGQTVTLSCWVKTDAATTFNVVLVQNFGSGGSGSVNTNAMISVTTTSGWVRYTGTLTVPSVAGKTIGAGSNLSVYFVLPNSGGFIRVGTFDLWGVQLEAGSVATPFTTASGTLSGELAACQRYFINFTGSASTPSMGAANTTAVNRVPFPLPVTMRTTPSASYSGTPQLYDGVTVTNISSLGSVYLSNSLCCVDISAASGLTQYRPYLLYFNSGTINLNAEL